MIKIIETGLYTSIQDLGRPQWHSLGIPMAGSMDQESARTANFLLQNTEDAALMEITMTGPILQFTEPTWIAFSGAKMPVYIDQLPARAEQPIWIKAGQEIRFGKLAEGLRIYMAIKGGFKTIPVLGSQAMCKNVTPYFMVKKGMELAHETGIKDSEVFIKKETETPLNTKTINAFIGPEFEQLPTKQQEALQEQLFSVSNLNNRMAYQLSPQIGPNELFKITTPVIPGTVQLTPEGTLMVLMRDGQTTGGYPRILQLTAKSINALAQLKTGDCFNFKIVSI